MSALCSGGLFSSCFPNQNKRLLHEKNGNGNGSSIFTAHEIKEAEDVKQKEIKEEKKKHELPYRPPDPSLILPQVNFVEHLVDTSVLRRRVCSPNSSAFWYVCISRCYGMMSLPISQFDMVRMKVRFVVIIVQLSLIG
jgi:hypothetical protein